MSDTTVAPIYPVALSLLKAGLGYYDSQLEPAVEAYLNQLLEISAEHLAERKIYLSPDNLSDALLQEMYAEWLYRKKTTGEGMPEMLSNEIRTRQVNKAVKA